LPQKLTRNCTVYTNLHVKQGAYQCTKVTGQNARDL